MPCRSLLASLPLICHAFPGEDFRPVLDFLSSWRLAFLTNDESRYWSNIHWAYILLPHSIVGTILF